MKKILLTILFGKTKKGHIPKSGINSSITLKKIPFNKWARMFNVSVMYKHKDINKNL
jgi:hypothetical protein